jgi:hypothetical protein
MLEHDQSRGERGHEVDHHGHREDECPRQVTIIVDTVTIHLHPGRYDLETIKRLSKVPLSDELDELVGTKLVPLPDDKPVVIKGCEIFASHPKSGGAS